MPSGRWMLHSPPLRRGEEQNCSATYTVTLCPAPAPPGPWPSLPSSPARSGASMSGSKIPGPLLSTWNLQHWAPRALNSEQGGYEESQGCRTRICCPGIMCYLSKEPGPSKAPVPASAAIEGMGRHVALTALDLTYPDCHHLANPECLARATRWFGRCWETTENTTNKACTPMELTF